MAEPIVSAEQLRIVSIRIESERFNRPLLVSSGGTSTGIVIEANIYEDLSKPFLTGDIILQDDQDLYRLADISGTEKVIIDFVTPDNSSDVITVKFIINEVTDSVKYNDFASVLVLSLVEDIKYFNDIQKFSKAYTGTGEEIIKAIVKDRLNRNVIIESEKLSAQKTFRYIVPYQNPFSAIKTILRKITTDNGLPFFFYSSIIDDNFYLTDLETIIQQDPFNKDRPFVYDQGNTIKSDLESQATNITSYEASILDDTLHLATYGGMGSKYESVNATTGKPFETHIDMHEHFEDLIRSELFPKDQNVINIDLDFIADPSGVNTNSIVGYDAKLVSRVISEPYLDANGFDQEAYPGQETLYTIRDNVIHHLLKNMYTINAHGLLFSISNITTCVGHLLRMNIYRNDMGSQSGSSSKLIDEKRSGDFVIISKRHCFDVAGERHNVAIQLSRIAQPGITR